jgi:hypothetical protein
LIEQTKKHVAVKQRVLYSLPQVGFMLSLPALILKENFYVSEPGHQYSDMSLNLDTQINSIVATKFSLVLLP